MNQRQRESLARFLYNIATIMFATLVVGNLAFKEFSFEILFRGGVGTAVAVIAALWLEQGGEK